MTNFEFSAYQQKIFDWVVNGRGDAVVQACAGSGKTFTLVECAKLLRSNKAVFLAFNKHIAVELQKRLGNKMTAKTIHSIGMSTLRSHLQRIHLDDNKYYDLAKPYAKEIAQGLLDNYEAEMRRWSRLNKKNRPKEPEKPPTAGFITNQLKKLAHFCMVSLSNVHDKAEVETTVEHFDCLDPALQLDQLYYPLTAILREGENLAANRGVISYDDMLYLPYKWNLEPFKQEWIFVDEAQDLSAAQLDLVLKMRGRGGRILFVGDPNQSIFGFAGASSDSIDQIIQKSQSTTLLPLSICYRCPTSHIKLAQQLVPQIEPAPNADEGIVKNISAQALPTIIREGDLVISRCTAPAVRLCIELISKRVPARVRGRDVGKSLTSIVKEVAEHPEFDFSRFGKFLNEYQEAKIVKLRQRKNSESQIESLRDRVEGVRVCWESFDSSSLNQFCREIEELFSDTRSSVTLSTVHRAKGLEEQRVFILRPDQLPLRWANQLEWEKEQELNLKYVALTRAKEALYFVLEEVDDEEDDEEARNQRTTRECLSATSNSK